MTLIDFLINIKSITGLSHALETLEGYYVDSTNNYEALIQSCALKAFYEYIESEYTLLIKGFNSIITEVKCVMGYNSKGRVEGFMRDICKLESECGGILEILEKQQALFPNFCTSVGCVKNYLTLHGAVKADKFAFNPNAVR